MDYFKNFSYMSSHLFLMLFIYLFVTHRYSKAKTVGICFSSFLILNVTDCLKLNIFPDSDLCYVSVTVFQIFVTQFTGIFISRTRDGRVLFMGLTASNYVISGSVVSSVVYLCTGDMLFSLIGGIAVHFVILAFLCVKIRDIWLQCYEREYMKDWWELCLIPVFFYCGFSSLAFFPHTLDDYPDNSFGVIIFIITMLVSYVAVFRYVESESNRAGIYWKNVLFEAYIKGLEGQYYFVEQAEKNLKILRHDMRHYSGMIDSLLLQKEYDEIKKITEYINGVTDENKVVRYCENLVIQSILYEITEKARTLGIDIHLDADIQKEILVNEYELAAVLANLLENALICVNGFEEKEKRYVNAKVRCTNEHLLIQMENRCEGEVIFDSRTGLPKSKKGRDHGLGMQSVSAFADKIGGNIGCFCENGVFSIIVFAKF